MARAQDQRRWRASTSKKRIEIYLPVDTVVRLDEMAAARGKSRAAVMAALIDAAPGHNAVAPGPAASPPAREPEPVPQEPEQPARPESATGQTAQQPDTAGTYSFRRPKHREEKRYEWIAVTGDGQRLGLRRNPGRQTKGMTTRWRGIQLDHGILAREAQGPTREAVVRRLTGL